MFTPTTTRVFQEFFLSERKNGSKFMCKYVTPTIVKDLRYNFPENSKQGVLNLSTE